MLIVLASLAVACNERNNMAEEARVKPYEPINFFEDGQSVRPPIEGTVARGSLVEDEAVGLGRRDGKPVDRVPIEVTARLVARGRERYNISCAPCHGEDGYGNGMIVQRGYTRPPSMHEDRLIAAPDGHFFDVITNGYGRMPAYDFQVPVEERWATVAYIRALQLSQRPGADAVAQAEPAASGQKGASRE